MGLENIRRLFSRRSADICSVQPAPSRDAPTSKPAAVTQDVFVEQKETCLVPGAKVSAPTESSRVGMTIAHSPGELNAKLDTIDSGAERERQRALEVCRRFIEDRHSLDDDASIEWIEGWHGVHQHNVAQAVPGITNDQGLFVQQPGASYMPAAAYWHPQKPPTPQHWTNSGAMVHFKIPRLLLETMGKWIEDPSAGNRFVYADDVASPPYSRSNRYIRVMPIQVLEVYWVRGTIPESCGGIGVDLTAASTWPTDDDNPSGALNA